jgi:hypothetical protein
MEREHFKQLAQLNHWQTGHKQIRALECVEASQCLYTQMELDIRRRPDVVA